jgi:Domain of unknown function (DUF4214)
MRKILIQTTPTQHSFPLLLKRTKSVLLLLSTALCFGFAISQTALAQTTFTNPTRITDGGSQSPIPCTPYPSSIAVSGLPGSISKVTVTLNNVWVDYSPDANVLLVGPNGRAVMLLSDAPGNANNYIQNMTLTFDDEAPHRIPADPILTSGTYKPTNFITTNDSIPSPAPAGPYGETLAIFNEANPNGSWALYVVNDRHEHVWDYGGVAILGGWSLTITVGTPSPRIPIDDPQFFVRQHYLDFLNREPDAAGLAFWMNEISSCGTDQQCVEVKRVNVSAAFFLSIEFQESGYFVYRMYKAAYGDRTGSPVPLTRQEFLPDTHRVGQSVVVGASGWELQLQNNKNAFANDFVTRARFTAALQATTPDQFVDALNANADGALSEAERNQLVSDLNSGAKTQAQVLLAVVEDNDLKNTQFNRAFVLMQYFGYLQRNPNDAPDWNFDGYNVWLSKLNQFNGNFINAEMVKAFISSIEYRNRFDPCLGCWDY